MNIVLKTAAVVMLVLSLNLQWALLQTVAWTGMIVSYSRLASFTNALTMTFDGKHPCALCKVVEAGRGDSKSQELQLTKLVNDADQGVIWEATDSITSGKWLPAAAPLRGNNGLQSFTDMNAPIGSRFYRIRQLNNPP